MNIEFRNAYKQPLENAVLSVEGAAIDWISCPDSQGRVDAEVYVHHEWARTNLQAEYHRFLEIEGCYGISTAGTTG